MNRSKIEYCDHTLNIITGCRYKCEYCYARQMSRRFSGNVKMNIKQRDKYRMEKGVYVVAFSYPVVPKGKARIRTQVCASHTKEDIDFIVKCFKEVREEMK